MSFIEDESSETLLALKAIEPTRRAELEAELQRRSAGLVEAVVNNPTGVIDALADGVPTSPNHTDSRWLHSPVNYPTIELGRE